MVGAHKKFYRIQHPEIYLLDLKVQYKHKMKLPLDMVSKHVICTSASLTKVGFRQLVNEKKLLIHCYKTVFFEHAGHFRSIFSHLCGLLLSADTTQKISGSQWNAKISILYEKSAGKFEPRYWEKIKRKWPAWNLFTKRAWHYLQIKASNASTPWVSIPVFL